MKYILVHSGKGGVGKTTISCTLAYMLKDATNKRVGFADLDISNPNAHYLLKPVQMDVEEDESGEYILPIPTPYGIKFFSTRISFPPDIAIEFDRERIEDVVSFMFKDIKWDVDYLVVDLPPGTTDLHNEVVEHVSYEDKNLVLVSTKHPMSLEDLERSIDYWKTKSIDIDAIILNLSTIFKSDAKIDYDTLIVEVPFYAELQNKIKPIPELEPVVKKIL